MRQGHLTYWITRHWLWVFSAGWGLIVGMPFLAPIFMQIGWVALGSAIYSLYSFLCHQLPQRSYFLFGTNAMLSLAEVQAAFQVTDNPLILRQFIGNSQVGWKVAWSDRMVFMYTSVLPLAWIWYAFRKRLGQLPAIGLALFLVPMGLDGVSHFISDVSGLGQGFRDSNSWLAALTGNAFPSWFYRGDALGSLNSFLRIGTGILFAIGAVWFVFPVLEQACLQIRAGYETRFSQLERLTHELEKKLSPPSRPSTNP